MLTRGLRHTGLQQVEITFLRVNLSQRNRVQLHGVRLLIVAIAQGDHGSFARFQINYTDTFRSNLRLVGKSSYLLGQLADGAIDCEFTAEDFEFVMHLRGCTTYVVRRVQPCMVGGWKMEFCQEILSNSAIAEPRMLRCLPLAR